MAHSEREANKGFLPPYKAAPADNGRQGIPSDLTAIFEHIADAFICIDRHWRYSYVNSQAEHLMGKSRAELLGRGVWEVCPTGVGATFFQNAHQVVEQQISREYSEYHDLLQKWLLVRIAPAQDGITVFLQDVSEYKHAEEQLRFQATILHSVTNSIIVTDLAGTITYCNEEAQRVFGYSPHELLGKTPALLYPDNNEAQLARNLQAILAGNDYVGEWLGRRKDSKRVWVEIRTTVIRDDHGEPSGFIGVAKDITLRKQFEGALHLQQQEFQAIAEHAPDIIMRFDTAYRHMYVNPAIEAATGLPPQAYIGKTDAEMGMPAYLLEPWERALHSVFTTGQKALLEFEFSAPTGPRWFESLLAPECDQRGAVVSVLVIARDISERNRLKAELQAAKEQLEAFLYNVDDGILVEDASGKIIYANLPSARLAGYSSVDELLQAPPPTYWERFDITDEQGQALSLAALPGRRAIKGETPTHINIRFLNRRTREARWARLKSTVIAATEQMATLVITFIQDITHFKELEQRKDEFILNVSHELRTPLTALNGYLELLKEHDARLDAQTKARFLQQALENGDELTRLVNSILDALHVPAALPAVQREALSLARVVRNVLAQFDPQQQAHALQVQVPAHLQVWADRQALQQVLRNLLANAFKYAPLETPVVVSAAQREETWGNSGATAVEICVQDAGPGIPPAEQALLFEKFVRLKRDLSGAVRGTGLGLYISKQLVEAMGGEMWVESSGRPGEGSRFCFTMCSSSVTT
jgi:PAS domain S-box-containing protein